MCDTCGCNITHGNKHLLEPGGKLSKVEGGGTAITVLKSLLSENDHTAAHNRQHFDKNRVLAINLMSSPGSGKTALLEAPVEALADRYRIAVIEGDLETENDAQRIRDKGVKAIQIQTGSACHLDAHMVHDALHELSLEDFDIVFIENVGNLVCPASFDLGQHINITLLSVTEGDDKPAKYPVMFRAADLMLLTKTDLLAVLDDFSTERAETYLRNLANEADVLQVSSRKGTGMDHWLDWLDSQYEQHLNLIESGNTRKPNIQPDGAEFHAQQQHG